MPVNQTLATAVPTFFHNRETCEDVSVWEITTSNGRTVLCQRQSVKGRVPLTVYGDSFFSEENGLVVCTAPIPIPKRKPTGIITRRDGFLAPTTWYGAPGAKEVDLSLPKPPVRKQTPVKKSVQEPTPLSFEESFPVLSSTPAQSPQPFKVSWLEIARNA